MDFHAPESEGLEL
ncbi:MAG: hypothetical protein J07AB43_03720, partial [Candidatus Nanosalina sp. J07AB43]